MMTARRPYRLACLPAAALIYLTYPAYALPINDDSPPAASAYGAFAYSKSNGAWGLSDAAPDKNSAEKSALGYCSKHSPDCEIMESFSHSCAAVASGTNNRLGWGISSDARQAGLDAIRKCGDSGSSGNPDDHSRCFVQLSHCYTD